MSVKKRIVLFAGTALIFGLAACGAVQQAEPHAAAGPEAAQESSTEPGTADQFTDPTTEPEEREVSNETQNDVEESMRFFIDNTEVSVAWEDNGAVDALIDLAKAEPLTVHLSMYGGFEQVGSLGTSLPRNDAQTTAEAGDIVLYSGNQIVVFYGSNSWAYTRLGRITDKTADEMADLLGSGDVTITISYGGQ